MADAYLGEIRAFAGTYAPQGWLFCDGSLKQIQEYNALFALIGTIYGGDGAKTFALPDLRGRLAIGMGQAPGLTNRIIGSNGGVEIVQLSTGQIPAHNHTVTVSTVTNPASVNVPNNTAYLGAISSPTGVAIGYVPASASGVTPKPLNNTTLASNGSSNPHNNMMPSAVVSYIICMNGFFPVKPS